MLLIIFLNTVKFILKMPYFFFKRLRCGQSQENQEVELILNGYSNHHTYICINTMKKN